MATILLVEDGPGPAGEAGRLLRQAGHRVVLCGGGPGPYEVCPLLRYGTCPLAEAADLILLALRPFPPLVGRTYCGDQLIKAYRSHPDFGSVPMVIASAARPDAIEGAGPIEVIREDAEPHEIALAVEKLLTRATHEHPEDPTFGPRRKGHMTLPPRLRRSQALLRR
jgi:hypothetical protein